VFLLNSRLTHFIATPLRGCPFFRSYGANLPSSFKSFHSRALVYSTHPPVSVSGTGTLVYTGIFLGKKINRSARACALTSPCGTRIISTWTVSVLAYSGLNVGGAGILNLLVIAYALRPRLRSRLTLGGRTFPRKPWVYGGQEFNLSYRYSCLHPHFWALHGWFPYRFTAPRTLSYHAQRSKSLCIRSFGIPLDRQSFSAPSLSMSQLLRTV
jgi:hypothetical protein